MTPEVQPVARHWAGAPPRGCLCLAEMIVECSRNFLSERFFFFPPSSQTHLRISSYSVSLVCKYLLLEVMTMLPTKDSSRNCVIFKILTDSFLAQTKRLRNRQVFPSCHQYFNCSCLVFQKRVRITPLLFVSLD